MAEPLSQTTHRELLEAVGAACETVDGLRLSERLLDPRTEPATKLNKLFSLHRSTRNTDKYRDSRSAQMRLALRLTVRAAWRLNPKNEAGTQATALDDEDRLVRALQTSTRHPLPSCRILYRETESSVSPSREWLFADVVFDVEFDRSLLAADNQ